MRRQSDGCCGAGFSGGLRDSARLKQKGRLGAQVRSVRGSLAAAISLAGKRIPWWLSLAVIVVGVSLVLDVFSAEHSWVEYAAAITFVIIWAAAAVWSVGRYHELVDRARQRGSRGPFLPVVIGAVLSMGLLCCPLIVEILGAPNRLRDWLTMAVVAPLWILGCCGFSHLLATGLVLLAPRRPQRPAGPRRVRFPWRFFAVAVLLVGTMLSVATMVWHWRPYHFDFGGWVFTVDTDKPVILVVWARPAVLGRQSSALLVWSFGRRARARTYDRVRADDQRAPVLYLRSFSEESDVFVSFPARRFSDKLVDAVEATARLEGSVPDEVRRPSFEQFFGPAFDTRIGPLVALGNPAEYLSPLGAAREYVADERWKGEIQRLAETSCCIVASAGRTAGLEWGVGPAAADRALSQAVPHAAARRRQPLGTRCGPAEPHRLLGWLR